MRHIKAHSSRFKLFLFVHALPALDLPVQFLGFGGIRGECTHFCDASAYKFSILINQLLHVVQVRPLNHLLTFTFTICFMRLLNNNGKTKFPPVGSVGPLATCLINQSICTVIMRQATGWRFIHTVIDVYHLPRHDFRISRARGIKMKRQGTDRIAFFNNRWL